MKTKHTKGEWIRKEGTIINPNYDHTKGNIHEIAQCYTGWDEKNTKEECLANAKLIAAAPELLESLNDMKIFFHSWLQQDENTIGYKAAIKAINAIKKATE